MQSGRLLREESERSGLVDALLYGRLLEKWAGGRAPTISGCHRAARMSLLPAKRSSATLRPSRRRIELRSLDVYSGWRLPCPAFETFRVWLDNNGTLCATGELLICHPNTGGIDCTESSNTLGDWFGDRGMSPSLRWL